GNGAAADHADRDPHARTDRSRRRRSGGRGVREQGRAQVSDVATLDHRHLWHPFTQMREWLAEEPLAIAAGEGNFLIDTHGRRYLDGVSSLWCNVHGHRHPVIDAAIRRQLERVAHSTMLGLTHAGAAELAAGLVEIAPPGLTRVFYSDA